MRERALVLGGVVNEPRTVLFWDALRAHFALAGQPAEYVLHSTYDRLVDALLAGQVDVAWCSPVAHLRVIRRTHQSTVGLLMRDTDRDLASVWFARDDGKLRRPADLAGRTLAVGGRDHPFTRLLPMHHLKQEGVDLPGVRLIAFDHEPGRHGESGRDELSILDAVRDGQAHAGALSERTWAGLGAAEGLTRIGLTPTSDGWVFDALPTLPSALRLGFERAMGALAGGGEAARRVLQLAGCTAFVPARADGHAALRAAMDTQTAW